MSDEIKVLNRARYSQFADRYVNSPVHSQGDDLARLLEFVPENRELRALDVATGGGHTALGTAARVGWQVASDLTLNMLRASREFLTGKGRSNLAYSGADAEALPFASGSFDLVTCRIAAHHFPDAFRFACECTRVLRPGGLLLVIDQVVPDDERAARYVNAFETLRDPSHVRAFAAYEWEGMLLDAGLLVEAIEFFNRRHELLDWAARQSNPPEVVEHLQILLMRAPDEAAQHLAAQHAGTAAASFLIHQILIAGRKPA